MIVGLAVVSLFCGPATAADDLPQSATDDEGFVSIFNGKDFEGWAGPTQNYETKDGCIVCKPRKGGTIYTKEEYSDFVVRFEFASSGWPARTDSQPSTPQRLAGRLASSVPVPLTGRDGRVQ